VAVEEWGAVELNPELAPVDVMDGLPSCISKSAVNVA
jgi:hypothetical protein